jgi:hypothetical protein
MAVEELLPNGAQGWAEVAALYQSRSGELILQDHDDVKQYWIEKCCNKFKKLTGNPGDPKRDMILRCQRIQERIHNKSASAIMGVDSEGDDGLSLDSEEEDEDDDDDDVEGEVAAVVGGELGVGGSRVGSRATTPTVVADGGGVDGGLGVCPVEEVGIPVIPPFITQQFTEGPYVGPQPVQTPQQLAFMPEENQQHGLVAVQPMVLPGVAHYSLVGAGRPIQQQVMPPPANQPQQPSTSQQSAKKKVKKSSESSSSSLNEKTKNSLSEKRGSFVKSIDKLASCLTTDEANSAAMASASASSGMMPMMLMMQMQHQQHQQQQQMQLQYQQQQQMMQQAFMQSQMELQVKSMQDRMLRK